MDIILEVYEPHMSVPNVHVSQHHSRTNTWPIWGRYKWTKIGIFDEYPQM